MQIKKISILTLTIASLFLAGCGKKTVVTAKPTPTPKAFEMALADRPIISLIPSKDGHTLTLKLDKVPSSISQIEYEVLYNAQDNGSEIEKGVGDTIKEISATISRSLLLGTESCTNGCKYKYDTGIIGGTVTLNFIDKNGQIATFESKFDFKTTADINKAGKFTFTTDNFSVTPKSKLSGTDYYIIMKSYQGDYSIFSSASNDFVGSYPATK